MLASGGHVAVPGGGAEEAGVVEKGVEPAWDVAKVGKLVLKEDVDATEENGIARLIEFLLI